MLKDILTKNLIVIFCGINPGLKSAGDGYHFSGRSNRFWKALHRSGFTPYEIQAINDTSIVDFGYGLTTAVARATSKANELSKEEFDHSLETFKTKIKTFQPKYIAFLGKQAYQAFSGKKQVEWGAQVEDFCGVKVWILPNPSGLNRGFSLEDLTNSYREFYQAISN